MRSPSPRRASFSSAPARRSAPAAIPATRSTLTLAEIETATRPSLRRVLNATGVLIHTNLGRAPLAQAALDRVAEVGGSYTNLEYDLEAGARGSSQDHLAALLGGSPAPRRRSSSTTTPRP